MADDLSPAATGPIDALGLRRQLAPLLISTANHKIAMGIRRANLNRATGSGLQQANDHLAKLLEFGGQMNARRCVVGSTKDQKPCSS
jgi:hypothetical protein